MRIRPAILLIAMEIICLPAQATIFSWLWSKLRHHPAPITRTVTAPLAITSGQPPPATVGVPYSFQLTASGGTPPYIWGICQAADLDCDGQVNVIDVQRMIDEVLAGVCIHDQNGDGVCNIVDVQSVVTKALANGMPPGLVPGLLKRLKG